MATEMRFTPTPTVSQPLLPTPYRKLRQALPQERQELKRRCAAGSDGACEAGAIASEEAGARADARTLYKSLCKKGSERWCYEAAKLTDLPKDVASLRREMEPCEHWGGEEPYDAGRAAQIARGVRADCKDWSVRVESLKKKYASNGEFLFAIEQLIEPWQGK
jgi:hypothetical protein